MRFYNNCCVNRWQSGIHKAQRKIHGADVTMEKVAGWGGVLAYRGPGGWPSILTGGAEIGKRQRGGL